MIDFLLCYNNFMAGYKKVSTRKKTTSKKGVSISLNAFYVDFNANKTGYEYSNIKVTSK